MVYANDLCDQQSRPSHLKLPQPLLRPEHFDAISHPLQAEIFDDLDAGQCVLVAEVLQSAIGRLLGTFHFYHLFDLLMPDDAKIGFTAFFCPEKMQAAGSTLLILGGITVLQKAHGNQILESGAIALHETGIEEVDLRLL